MLLPDKRLMPLVNDDGRLNPEIATMIERSRDERRRTTRGHRRRF